MNNLKQNLINKKINEEVKDEKVGKSSSFTDRLKISDLANSFKDKMRRLTTREKSMMRLTEGT